MPRDGTMLKTPGENKEKTLLPEEYLPISLQLDCIRSLSRSMDPFSITLGALALAETANKLASSLTDRYRAFSSAPKEMLEIAGQVTMCAGLVDVFARSVDGIGQNFPKRFQQDVSTLVMQVSLLDIAIDLLTHVKLTRCSVGLS